MKDKGHFTISLIKSAVRILGCIIAVMIESLSVLSASLVLAEILGIAEELLDERG